MNAGKVPSVRRGIGAQLFCRFGERDVHTRLPVLETIQKKLKAERCLSGTGIPFDQVNAMGGKSPTQHVVETADPCGRPFNSESSCTCLCRALHIRPPRTLIFS